MKKIKDEIQRIEGTKGNVVLVNKASYLSLLKELSVLRFKVRKAEDWDTPAQVASFVRHGYMHQYWNFKDKGEKKMAEENTEIKVASEKVAAFQKYLGNL